MLFTIRQQKGVFVRMSRPKPRLEAIIWTKTPFVIRVTPGDVGGIR
jgi:hypothetical protein